MRTGQPQTKSKRASTIPIAAARMQKTTAGILLCCCLSVCTANLAAAENTITFYRDGTLIRQESGAVKGIIDIPLADGMMEHSLTAVPAPGTTIISVETRNTGGESSAGAALEVLEEQRKRLEDRLQALETREAIFTAAAKAQSGKAPRKSKANPDPMQGIRQGTDFAIAQLEAVYTARRKTTLEIRKIEARLATARKGGPAVGSSVRIAVTPPRGRVTVSYATAERGWQPQYNLHLAGDGFARLQLSARLTGGGRGLQPFVSPGALADSATAGTFPARSGSVVLAGYRMPLTNELYATGVFNRFSGMLTNSTPHYLPPGESGLFRSGTYLGRFRFEGLSSGRSRVVSLGM